MAVENDYNLLVSARNLARRAGCFSLQAEIQQRLLQEKRDGLEPNETRWVELLITRLPLLSGPATQLEHEASRVLRSRRGEAVFDAEPPSAPDTL